MELLHNIISLFNGDAHLISFKENFRECIYEVSATTINIPIEVDVTSLCSIIPLRDQCVIRVQIAEAEPIIYNVTTNNYSDFVTEIADTVNAGNVEDSNTIRIEIRKNKIEKELSIYSIDAFAAFLRQTDLEKTIRLFAKEVSNEGLIFRCWGIDGVNKTSTIAFSKFDNTAVIFNYDFKDSRADKVYTSVYASNVKDAKVIPEDFLFEEVFSPVISNGIIPIFSQISYYLSLVSLFDITKIEGDRIDFKLNGYKSISGTLELNSSTPFMGEELLKIYHWVYESGNLTDKLGLARNIISLHLDLKNGLQLSGDIYHSVLSSYKVYEKQNIKQYIEIRNKISDQLLDFNKRATQIVDSFASGFQKNALVLVTFFSTIIAIKFLGTNYTPKANFNSFILSVIFIIISVFYLIISRLEIKTQKQRFDKSYNNLKERYTDLLTTEDIALILNKDKEYVEDISFITDKARWYTNLWILVLVLISIASFLMFSSGVLEYGYDILLLWLSKMV